MTKQFEKKHLKQFKNQAQSGRSMVEMLGVLAIIGVLSIGGIAGYRWGMDKHVSNQILYEMNLNSTQLAMLLQKGNPDGVTLSLGSPYDDGKFRTVEYGFAYACGEEASFGHECEYLDETMYSMTATGLPKRVCNMLSDAASGLAYASELDINDGADECNDTNNTVTVFFDTDTTTEGGIPRPEESETHTPVPEVTEPTTTTESTTPETTTTEATTMTEATTTTTTVTTTTVTTTDNSRCGNGRGDWVIERGIKVCACDSSWGGEDCSYSDLEEPCHYRGLWCGSNCACHAPGWGGRDCSESGYCNNHGGNHWFEGPEDVCECEDGWSGDNCEICTGLFGDCDKCNGNGYWDSKNNRCNCKGWWCGTDCSQINSNYCGEHGRWWGYWGCHCYSGYYGDRCEKKV